MTLDEAEDAMLELTCERAELRDGMDILELGCGWGSLTLFMAERFPNARITAGDRLMRLGCRWWGVGSSDAGGRG